VNKPFLSTLVLSPAGQTTGVGPAVVSFLQIERTLPPTLLYF